MAGEAASAAGDVLGAINELWNIGGGISTGTAQSAIDSAMNFSAAAQQVIYEPPSYVAPSLIQGSAGTAPTVSNPGVSLQSADFTARDIDGTLATGTADAPTLAAVTIPDAPAASVLPAIPAQPGVGAVTVEAAPVIAVSVADAPDVPAVGAAPDLSGVVAARQVLAALELPTIDDADIDAALNRLRGQAAITIPGYLSLVPEVFDAAGSLLAGDLVLDVDALFAQVDERAEAARQTHDSTLLNLWSARGLDAGESAIAQYNTVMDARFAAQRDTANEVARTRWTNDLFRAAFDVGTAAHTMAMDIELALYDVEFAALTAHAEARLEVAKALIARFNADVLMATVAADRYAGANEGIRAAAARYKGEAGIVDATAQLNAGIADAFAAGERAKAVEADTYRARLSGNEAKIKALRSRNEALAAQAEAAGVVLEDYKARALAWSGEVERSRTDYAVFSARARGVVAQNRAQAARAQLSGSRNEVVAVQAQAAAVQASASAARVVAAASSQAAQYTAVELHNTIEGLKARLGAGAYQRQVMEWAAQADVKAGALEGWAGAGAAAVRFSISAAEAAGRAAQMSQEISTKIAGAHAIAIEAAGRAKAAIESGRYAGFRASAVLSASGSFGESIGVGNTTSNSTDTNTSYNDRYTY